MFIFSTLENNGPIVRVCNTLSWVGLMLCFIMNIYDQESEIPNLIPGVLVIGSSLVTYCIIFKRFGFVSLMMAYSLSCLAYILLICGLITQPYNSSYAIAMFVCSYLFFVLYATYELGAILPSKQRTILLYDTENILGRLDGQRRNSKECVIEMHLLTYNAAAPLLEGIQLNNVGQSTTNDE